MVILVCGSRDWTDKEVIRQKLMSINSISLLVHGACRGADLLAADVAQELNIPAKAYPAQWDIYGLSAGPRRNQQMLDYEKPELVIAFHENINSSKGTKDMVNRASKVGVRVEVIGIKS